MKGGYKLLRISTDILMSLLRYDGIGRKETFSLVGIPADAEIVDISTEEMCLYGRFTLKLRSGEWPENKAGEMMPVVDLNCRTFRYAECEQDRSGLAGRISH